MQQIIHQAFKINGDIIVPGDKSISHRAVILGSLANGITEIYNFLMGDDCLSTISCFRKLGIEVDTSDPKRICIHGKGVNGLQKPLSILDAGNSGTTSRILLGILAGQPFESEITGDASLRKRPMRRVVHPLSMMGAAIEGKEDKNYLPLQIKGGTLQGIDYALPVASAQLKTSLLMAGLFADGTTSIREPVPSRNHTELMLKSFGANLTTNGNSLSINRANDLYAQPVYIPGDISSASFFITAALIIPNSCIRISNVGVNPTRTGILDVFHKMGANIKMENMQTQNGEPSADLIVNSSDLKGTIIEGDIIPRLIDEIPIIAVAAAFAQGTTIIRNAEELQYKESNRIEVMAYELSRMGVQIAATADGLVIQGGNPLKGNVVQDYMDHRVAMAMSIAGLGASGETIINGSNNIYISYPDFYKTLESIITQ